MTVHLWTALDHAQAGDRLLVDYTINPAVRACEVYSFWGAPVFYALTLNSPSTTDHQIPSTTTNDQYITTLGATMHLFFLPVMAFGLKAAAISTSKCNPGEIPRCEGDGMSGNDVIACYSGSVRTSELWACNQGRNKVCVDDDDINTWCTNGGAACCNSQDVGWGCDSSSIVCAV
ncbi:hypothetical protein BST61_g3012 [Cercospora zeina]